MVNLKPRHRREVLLNHKNLGLELHAGAEWTLFDLLALRIGMAERSGSLESVRQLTAGVGLNLRFVTGAGAGLDYAFANHPALGGSHRISLRIRF